MWRFVASAGLVILVVASAGAEQVTTTTTFTYSSSSTLPEDFYCEFVVRLYDPVEVSALTLAVGRASICHPLVAGTTIRRPPFSLVVYLENFPPGFRGPAAILRCEGDFHHSECAPTLEEADEEYFGVTEAKGADGASIPLPAVCTESIDCDRSFAYCGDPGPYEADLCADIDRSHSVTAGDALEILLAALGVSRCPPTVCDVNRDARVSATDALIALLVSVGRDDVLLACPAPCSAG